MSGRRIATWFCGVVAIGALVAAAGLSTGPHGIDETPMPLPTVEFTDAPVAAPADPVSEPEAGWPANRLIIPSLGVDAPVETIKSRGREVLIPHDPAIVGLFDEAATCTATEGTTLVTGHVSSYGTHGALYSISTMRPGDEAILTCPDGSITRWQVTGMRSWPKYTKTTKNDETIYDTQGQRRLVLLTCGGRVITSGSHSGHYADLVAVYLEPTTT